MRRLLAAAAIAAALVLFAGPKALAAFFGDIDFRIRRGAHDSTPRGITDICVATRTNRTLTYQILFTPSCAYTTAQPGNQLDWNKAPGFSTVFIHRNSIRLGWRYLPAEDKVELGFYGYIQGQRIEQALTKVALDTWTDIEVRMHDGGLAVRAGPNRYERNQSLGFSSWFPTPTMVLRTCYFGGDETAPHDMTVRVRGMQSR